jgi:hypothetical protein
MSPQGSFFPKSAKKNTSFSPKNAFFIKIFSENSIEHTLTAIKTDGLYIPFYAADQRQLFLPFNDN